MLFGLPMDRTPCDRYSYAQDKDAYLHLFLPRPGLIIMIKPLNSNLIWQVSSGQTQASESDDLSKTKQSLGLSYRSPLTFKHMLAATRKIRAQHKTTLWFQSGCPTQKESYLVGGS